MTLIKDGKKKETNLLFSNNNKNCNNKKSTLVLQGSGWLDSLGLNTPQNRMKNALWNGFNR